MSVDEVKGLVSFLLSRPAVTALVAARVYGEELPASLAATMPLKAIVINSTGLGGRGMSRHYMPIGYTTKDLRCYGETPAQARRVWDAAHNELKLMTRGAFAGVKMYGVAMGAPAFTREPDVEWPLCFGVIDVMAAETTA